MHLDKKTIILIGCVGSIGKNLATYLSNLSEYKLILVDRESAALKDLSSDLGLSFHSMDLLDRDNIYTSLKNIIDLNGGEIYGLIFNSAQTTEGLMKEYKNIPSYETFPLNIWDEGLQINLSSFYQVCQIIAPYMIKSHRGKIIAMASMYGVSAPTPELYKGQAFHVPAVYTASKAALIGLIKWLASFLGEHNININAVSPGGVFNNQDPEFVETLLSLIPLKRMATKDDINGIIRFLLSDESNYACGHNFVIDGGYTIR